MGFTPPTPINLEESNRRRSGKLINQYEVVVVVDDQASSSYSSLRFLFNAVNTMRWLGFTSSTFFDSLQPRSLFPAKFLHSRKNMNINSPTTSVSCANNNVGNITNQILMVGSIPVLRYDRVLKIGSIPILMYCSNSSRYDPNPCDSSSDDVCPDEMMRSQVDSMSEDTSVSHSESVCEREDEGGSPVPDYEQQLRELSLPTEFGMKRKQRAPLRTEKQHYVPKNMKYVPKNMKYVSVTRDSGVPKRLRQHEPFDICCMDGRNSYIQGSFCVRMSGTDDMLGFVDPEEMVEFSDIVVLRPGMVLLKNYLSLNEQVEIVKKCRELGLGPGGFYQPVFQRGAKLRLQMMCLGLNWDAETRKYEDIRPVDGTRPPAIPNEFSYLVERAIQDAHTHLKDEFRCSNVEEVLPSMTPNICITNFYTKTGRLGLHQDRDESVKSLRAGLPVISFSIGDSADFLYGDHRDIEKAESVVLESGDVLIFGGLSRHIFHGVSSIIPNSAPDKLLEQTSLRPGRLNLTFRKF